MQIQNIKTAGEGLHILQANGLRGVSWALVCTLPLLAIRDVIATQMGGPAGSPFLVLTVRALLIIMSVAVLLAPRYWPRLVQKPHITASVFLPLIVLMVDLTIARTGGGQSPIFAGLLTVMVGWAYFMPLPPSIAALIFLLVVLSYEITVIAMADVTILGQVTIAFQTGYLILGAMLAWLANTIYRSDQIARFEMLIEQKRLCGIDALTGCANRRELQERMERACRRAQRFNQYVACLVVDIDDFKLINDQHGHAAGDQVLQHLGYILREGVGTKGLAARWGGEEFVVLLPGRNEAAAASLAEKFRQWIETSPVELDTGSIAYTISIGVHADAGEECTSMAAMLDPADEALYLAKSQGKNRVCLASGLEPRAHGVTSQLRIRTAAPAEEGPPVLESSEFAQQWLEDMGYPALIRFGVVVCALTILLEPLDALWRLAQDKPAFLDLNLFVRGMVLMVVGGSLVAARFLDRVRRRISWLHILLPPLCALAFSLLSYNAGAEEGSSFIALMFLLVVVSFTTPGGLRLGIPLAALLTCSWPLTIVALKTITGEPINTVGLMVRTSTIVIMAIVCLILQRLFHQIRFEQASVKLQLERTSTTDRLTGASNRRVFETRLSEEIEGALREQTPLVLILMDLDHLKEINDTHGHLVGDEVLSGVAQAVQGEIRSIDVFARLGGDEFALILPGTHSQGAMVLTQRIRTRLERQKIVGRKQRHIPISVSMGVSVLDHNQSHDDTLPKDFYDQADRAVYLVKQKGRNAVAIWNTDGPEMASVPPNQMDTNTVSQDGNQST